MSPGSRLFLAGLGGITPISKAAITRFSFEPSSSWQDVWGDVLIWQLL